MVDLASPIPQSPSTRGSEFFKRLIDREIVKVLITPRKEDLNNFMELSQSGVVAHQNTTPDQRTDASEDNAQLIDVEWIA